MASAWGNAWGGSWGNAWGTRVTIVLQSDPRYLVIRNARQFTATARRDRTATADAGTRIARAHRDFTNTRPARDFETDK